MPALSNPTLWRTHPQSFDFYVYFLAPTKVFEARINGNLWGYPLAELTYDGVVTGSYTDISPGMLITFGSTRGGDDYGRQIVRKAATSTVIYIGQSSQGIGDGEVYLIDDYWITVWDFRPIAPKIPRALDDGTLYKWYEQDFATYGLEPPPVANAGPGYAEFVDPDTDVITVNFTDADSFGVATNSGTLTHSWDFADGTPSTSSSEDPGDVTFPEGFRYISHTVTDALAHSHTAYAPVLGATEDGTYRPTRCVIQEHVRRADGTEIKIRLLEDLPRSTYVDGTLCMIWARERLGTTVGSLTTPTNRSHMVFIGWIDQESHQVSASDKRIVKNSVIKVIDAAGRLKQIPSFSQEIMRYTAATTWTQMQIDKVSANIATYAHYLLYWHSTVLELTDFTWAGTDYPFSWLSSDGSSLFEQVDGRCQAIAHLFTCDRLGRLWIKPDPQLQFTAYRTSVVEVPILESDWAGVSTTYTRAPRNHWLRSSALLISTGDSAVAEPVPTFSIAPGTVPGWGLAEADQNYQLVKAETELWEREGRRYVARLNARNGYYDIPLTHGAEAGIEPALMEFVTLTVSSDNANRRGDYLTTVKLLPIELTYTYNHKNGTRQAHLSAEREVTTDIMAVYDPPPPRQDTVLGDWSGGDWAWQQIDTAIDLPDTPVLPDWGPEVTYNPTSDMTDPHDGSIYNGRMYMAVFDPADRTDWRIVKITWTGASVSYADISPNDVQRYRVGEVVRLVVDPYDYKRLIVAGSTGFVYSNDVVSKTTPTWNYKTFPVVNALGTVTFDTGGYSDYVLTTGRLRPSGGHPGKYIDGGSDGTNQHIQIRINFPKPLSITHIQCDMTIGITGGYCGMYWRLFDANDTDLYTRYQNNSAGGAGNWGPTEPSIQPDVDNASYCILKADVTSGSTNVQLNIDNIAFVHTDPSPEGFSNLQPVFDFQPALNRKNAFFWLAKCSVGGTDYVYLGRSLDAFAHNESFLVAKYDADLIHSLTINPHNWRDIYVSAGSIADGTAAIYESHDGGSTFSKTATTLNTKGGQLWWNWATQTANQRNTTVANLLWMKGLDGSNHLQIVKGLTGTPVTIVTDATRYGETQLSMGANARDLDYVRFLARTGHFYKSQDGSATWAYTATAPGDTNFVARGWWQYPKDKTFAVLFGKYMLCYTTDTGATFTDLWSGYSTWAAGQYGGDIGKDICNVVIDLSRSFTVVVT